MEHKRQDEIVRNIKEKLAQIEKRENIRILFACESGSRAWGFASSDSDYDVRFVFVRQAEDYLKINEPPDFLNCELNEIYDINGWDLKKFFKQLYKSNPVIFEWASSPIVYKETAEWASVKSSMSRYVNLKTMIHHYLGLANHILEEPFAGEKVKRKKYLYLSRAVLAASWIFYRRSPAPAEYSELVKAEIGFDGDFSEDEKASQSYFWTLKGSESESSEKSEIERFPAFEIILKNTILEIEKGIKKLKDEKSAGWEELDEIFLKIVKAGVAGGV